MSSTPWRARTSARVSDHPSRAQAEAAAKLPDHTLNHEDHDALLWAIHDLADVTGRSSRETLRQVVDELRATTKYRREIVEHPDA